MSMKKGMLLMLGVQAMMAQTMFDPNNRFNDDLGHPLLIDPPKKPLKEPFPDCVQKKFDVHTKLNQDNNIGFNFQRKKFDIDNNSTTIYDIVCYPYISYGNQKGKAKKIRLIKKALENYVSFTKIEDLSNDPFFIIKTTHVFN